MLKELEEKGTRLESAKKAAGASDATERVISDCKMIEQEYIALCKRTKALVEKSGTDADRKKMATLESVTAH
jgi:hypothetical protein